MSHSSRLLFVQRPTRPLDTLATRAQAWGSSIATCFSGDEMVAALDRAAVDVILLDAGVEESAEIVGWLKAQPQTRRIPLVTVAIEQPAMVAAHALALGADDMIELPVGDAELYARICALSRLRVMELERVRREAVLREFGVKTTGSAPAVPVIEKIGILLIGPCGQQQVQVVSALGGAAAIAYAETGEGALERLRRQDLEVAIITGTGDHAELQAFCQAVRADGALYHLPVMLIARSDLFSDRAKPFEWGVSDVLFQPFHPEVLRLRVNGWVRQQRLRRLLRGLLNGDVLPPTVDRLTRLYGHGFLHRYLEHEIEHARGTAAPLALAAFAVDQMTRVNREYGFVVGDRVLSEIGSMIARSTRAEDLPARYDGDRFCVVLEGVDAAGALSAADRVANMIGRTPFPLDERHGLQVTVRTGVATLAQGEGALELIARAFGATDAEPYRRAS